MKAHECAKCGWVINKPMNKAEIKRVLSEANAFISRTISNRHALNVIRKVVNRLAWQKELVNYVSDDYPFCRYCVLELIELFMKQETPKFKKELLDNYDFGASVIY